MSVALGRTNVPAISSCFAHELAADLFSRGLCMQLVVGRVRKARALGSVSSSCPDGAVLQPARAWGRRQILPRVVPMQCFEHSVYTCTCGPVALPVGKD